MHHIIRLPDDQGDTVVFDIDDLMWLWQKRDDLARLYCTFDGNRKCPNMTGPIAIR
jgi:hypothetical protein